MARLDDPSNDVFLQWGLPVPMREYQFHPTEKWRFDYAWPDQGLVALELQGGTWRTGHGAHRGLGYRRDIKKFNEAQILGWCVLQQETDRAWTEQTIEWLRRAFKARF